MSGLFGIFGGGSNSSSFSSRSASHGGHAGGPAYSLARLQQLYDRLSRFRESDLEKSGGGDALVEIVRQITEALIWGEQHDAHFFDFFAEKNILADFVRVFGLPRTPKKVKLQLLQTLQMLIQNIRQKTSVYYLLSQNHVNRLINTPFDFSDEEVLAYYITLMKSLAMRLDMETIKFFFIQHHDTTFPLYIEATKFFSHRDQMVRATVRTITLQVYRVQDEPMQQFVLRHARESYFSKLALHLRDLWLRLDVAAAGAGGERGLSTVQGENELQQDLQIYLSDVFELEVATLNEALADRLLNCAMLPVLVSGIAYSGDGAGTPGSAAHDPETQRVLAPAVALFLLRQVLETFRSPVLLGPLVSALLQPCVPAALAYALPTCGAAPEPSAEFPPDFVQNSIRGQFLDFLTGGKEAHVLLSAAVVHACIRNRAAAAGGQLEAARVLPADAAQVARADDPAAPTHQPSEEGDCEVLMLLVKALQSNSSWQFDTMRVYVRILLDILLGSSLDHYAKVWEALLKSIRCFLAATVQRVSELLQEAISNGSSGDGLLDIFAEEWELHKEPFPDVASFCGSPRRLLPCLLWASPGLGKGGAEVAQASRTGSGEAQRAVSAFLQLRRLLALLERQPPQAAGAEGERSVPLAWDGPSSEPTPLQLEEQGTGAISEGMSFAIGHVEKIVCGVASPNGKWTRYLLLHDHWLLLVQPDVGAPGWAVAKTVRPIWQVQSIADRSDPRTLQLGLPPLPGSSRGAEVAAQGAKGLSTMSLNFEDVKRAHAAAAHLQKQRRDARAKLLLKAAAFVDSYLAQLAGTDGIREAA